MCVCVCVCVHINIFNSHDWWPTKQKVHLPTYPHLHILTKVSYTAGPITLNQDIFTF